MRANAPLLVWKIHVKFGLKIQPKVWADHWIPYRKTSKEASIVLCSAVKHLGSGRALKEVGETLHYISCFPPLFFQALPFPACSTAEQSTVKASLFVNKF